MKKNNPALRRYCRLVKRWLPCGGKVAKQILGDVSLNIEAYLAENPDADFQQIQQHFGEPKAIACSYVDAQNTEDILSALRLRRRILAMVAGLLLAILAVWGAFILWAVHDVRVATHGYYETEDIFYGR